jgi:di-N-acetylchitobiase
MKNRLLFSALLVAFSTALVVQGATLGGSLRRRREPKPLDTYYTVEQGCPCSDVGMCQPIQTGPRPEVFVFQVNNSNWRTYDWLKVTTVVLYDGFNPHMYCYAHSVGVRVVMATSYPASNLLNSSLRTQWVQQQLQTVQQYFLDGVNVDFEDPIAEDDSAKRDALTLLMVELDAVLRPAIAGGGQITFDVAWRPPGIDVRFYDYRALAVLTDFLVIMDYDTRSQVFNVTECLAGPNAPAYTVLDGISAFLALYNDTSKFVLGVPWYGYQYPCTNSYEGPGTLCHIKRTIPPWRGCNCSDAAGQQIPYNGLMDMVHNDTSGVVPLSTEDVNTTAAGYGLYVKVDISIEGGQAPWYQLWYDNPDTLAVKYSIAKANGLRGISMWNVDCLSDSNSGRRKTEREAMWSAMDAFLKP